MPKTLKNICLGLLVAVLLFVPTYVALIHYFANGSWYSTLTGEQTVLTVTDVSGKPMFTGTAGTPLNSHMTKMLGDMIAGAQTVREKPDAYTDAFDVSAKLPGRSFHYRLYYTTTDRSYLEDTGSGTMYSVSSAEMLTFMQEFFYAKSDAELDLPVLRVGDVAVSPAYLRWSHLTDGGHFGILPEVSVVGEEQTYESAREWDIAFDQQPDQASLRVTSGSEILYEGALSEFPGLSSAGDSTLKVVLQARWTQQEGRAYYGEAGYTFYLHYSGTPVFTIGGVRDTSVVTIGEYLVLNVENATESDTITVTCEPSLGVTPVFYPDGYFMRAIVPLPLDLKGGTYRLTVEAKGESRQFDLLLEERSTLYRTYEADKTLIASGRSEAALAEYTALIERLGSAKSDRIYFSGTFADYRKLTSEEVNVSLKLGFGHYRTLSQTKETYRMDGVDFVISSALLAGGPVNIPVLNAGKVDYVGECAYLGKFVVVDHGMGLRSWYCHLSETAVSVGQVLEKDQAVGKTGSTGFTTDSGVYLICTVGTTVLSPYNLWDYGVAFDLIG